MTIEDTTTLSKLQSLLATNNVVLRSYCGLLYYRMISPLKPDDSHLLQQSVTVHLVLMAFYDSHVNSDYFVQQP